MGIWPFGREPQDVELASRIVTARARDGVTVRGKLTLHFAEAQTQAAADDAADRCAVLAETILGEAANHAALMGGEDAVVAELLARFPVDISPARLVELAALHVVGDVRATQPRRPGSSASMRAVRAGTTPIPPTPPAPRSGPVPVVPMGTTSTPVPAVRPGEPTVAPLATAPEPPAAGPTRGSSRPPRRVSSGRIRAISTSLLVPRGASPQAIGAALAPIARDAAGRLLVGTLRTYDLVVVRGHALDADSAEALATLVPVPEGPPGAYETARATELTRWHTTLGAQTMTALRHEIAIVTAYLGYASLARAGISKHLATVIVEAFCAIAFPDAAPALELGRYEHAREPAADQLAARLGALVRVQSKHATLSAALSPLLAAIEEELAMAANLLRQSSGIG